MGLMSCPAYGFRGLLVGVTAATRVFFNPAFSRRWHRYLARRHELATLVALSCKRCIGIVAISVCLAFWGQDSFGNVHPVCGLCGAGGGLLAGVVIRSRMTLLNLPHC